MISSGSACKLSRNSRLDEKRSRVCVSLREQRCCVSCPFQLIPSELRGLPDHTRGGSVQPSKDCVECVAAHSCVWDQIRHVCEEPPVI